MLLGMLGVFKYIAEDQAAIVLNAILDIVGVVVALYGNRDAHRRLSEAEKKASEFED